MLTNELPVINPLNAELNPICHLLALLGGATIVVVSKLRVNGENASRVCARPYRNLLCCSAVLHTVADSYWQ